MLRVTWALGLLRHILKTALMLFVSYAKKFYKIIFLHLAKMKRHSERNHSTLVGKNILFFKPRLHQMKGMQRFIYSTTISRKKLLEVSYLISKKIALAGEANTIAKNLIKPCIFEAAKILLCKNNYKKLESIPLSNNTVSRCIDNMGMYIKFEVYSHLQQVNFLLSDR